MLTLPAHVYMRHCVANPGIGLIYFWSSGVMDLFSLHLKKELSPCAKGRNSFNKTEVVNFITQAVLPGGFPFSQLNLIQV